MRAALLVLLLSSQALAEAALITSGAGLDATRQVQLTLGTRSVGLGVLLPEGPGAAWGAEGAFAPADRVLELRGGRQWRLTSAAPGFALSAQLGASAYALTAGDFDLGAGPQAGLTLGWAGQTLSLDLGAQAGVEYFVRSKGPRYPLRALGGLGLRFGRLSLGLWGLAGADLETGYFPVLRMEGGLRVRFWSLT